MSRFVLGVVKAATVYVRQQLLGLHTVSIVYQEPCNNLRWLWLHVGRGYAGGGGGGTKNNWFLK
jgi:hypothetical protein